jgi:glucokinase
VDTRARVYVGVSGPPASGKSTLAPLLAARLGLPLLAKDTIKDALMQAMPPADVAASRELGRAAVAAMFALAAESPVGAVLESVFYRSRAAADIRALPGRFVEVFCRCDRRVALARYRARAETRAPGHFDAVRPDAELWDPEVSEPVAGGWPVVVVDTNEPGDLDVVVADIERLVAATGPSRQGWRSSIETSPS